MELTYGKAKAVYGVLSIDYLTVYRSIAKLAKRYSEIIIDYVTSPDDPIPEADILVFSNLECFVSNHRNIHDEMVCVLCAGPLQLDSIKELTPLDFEKKISYEYLIHKPDYRKVVAKSRTSKVTPVVLSVQSIDHLTSIAETTITGSNFLRHFNKLTAISNHRARYNFRHIVSQHILGKKKRSDLEKFCATVFKKKSIYTEFVATLSKKETKTVIETVLFAYENTITDAMKIVKKKELDAFEIRFFLKMVKEHFPKEANKDE